MKFIGTALPMNRSDHYFTIHLFHLRYFSSNPNLCVFLRIVTFFNTWTGFYTTELKEIFGLVICFERVNTFFVFCFVMIYLGTLLLLLGLWITWEYHHSHPWTYCELYGNIRVRIVVQCFSLGSTVGKCSLLVPGVADSNLQAKSNKSCLDKNT